MAENDIIEELHSREAHIDKLERLTQSLPVLTPDRFLKMVEASSLFLAEEGTILGWKLIKNFGFGVHQWFISKDATMGIHAHDNIETICVAKGVLHISFPDSDMEDVVLKDGMSVRIEPNITHNAISTQDTWAITITIPFAQGFPDE